jgi:hypothetical protein
MLRIGSMNMLLHGVENPDVVYSDSLSQDHAGEEEKYTLVRANPPFAGSPDYESCAKDLQQVVKTKKTELLFLALFLRLLKPGGRAAVIVPDGVLFGSSNVHKTLRKVLVEDQKLDAVVSLHGGVFTVTAGLKCAPEMPPKVKISATRIAPVAIVFASNARATFDPARHSAMMREPITVATKKRVPVNSAVTLLCSEAVNIGVNGRMRMPRKPMSCRQKTCFRSSQKGVYRGRRK